MLHGSAQTTPYGRHFTYHPQNMCLWTGSSFTASFLSFLSSFYISNRLKNAEIFPILKCNYICDPDNYRPISLTGYSVRINYLQSAAFASQMWRSTEWPSIGIPTISFHLWSAGSSLPFLIGWKNTWFRSISPRSLTEFITKAKLPTFEFPPSLSRSCATLS